MRPNLFFI